MPKGLTYDLSQDALIVKTLNEVSSLSHSVEIHENHDISAKGQFIETGSLSNTFQITPIGDVFARYFKEDSLLDGLIAWWLLDEATGSYAADSAGNSHTGSITVGNGYWTERKPGVPAFDFDKVVSIIYAQFNNNEDHVQNGSISLWYKTSQTGEGGYGYTCGNMNWLNDRYGFAIGWWGTKVVMEVANASTFRTAGLSGTMDNNWHHIVGTWSPTEVAIWHDGVFVESTSGITLAWTTVPFTIGDGPSAHNFTGSLSDIRLYNRVLSQNEIQTIYNTTL